MTSVGSPSLVTISNPRKAPRPPTEEFPARESRELVIAFSRPLGCGIESAVSIAESLLQESGYKVTRIKLSTQIVAALEKGRISAESVPGFGDAANRYSRLQDGGNALRKLLRANEVLAEWAVSQIALTRTSDIKNPEDPDSIDTHIPEKRAFLIDQLKHPAEVELLRAVYRNLFFLVGVLSVEKRRRERLLEKGMSKDEVEKLVERDRNEPADHGQHLDKTLELADFFLRNDRPNTDVARNQLRRLLELIHGSNGVTPTSDEFGMYVAYASSLASACLSRQVGAAILDTRGSVLGTGCNEVPRPGGGLYSPEAGAHDARCFKMEGQKCWNDWHKERLRNEIIKALVAAGEGIDEARAQRIADSVYSKSRIKHLIEFSRAVHAETEAIISVARKGLPGLLESTLYTTTFPCHACARHVIAAGISKVVYVQPYERSLALELHGDSIALEPEGVATDLRLADGRKKVEFVHFEGVAPRRYVSMFLPRGERKQGGVAVTHPLAHRQKSVPEYLDSYKDFELKVIKHWKAISENVDPGPKGA